MGRVMRVSAMWSRSGGKLADDGVNFLEPGAEKVQDKFGGGAKEMCPSAFLAVVSRCGWLVE